MVRGLRQGWKGLLGELLLLAGDGFDLDARIEGELKIVLAGDVDRVRLRDNVREGCALVSGADEALGFAGSDEIYARSAHGGFRCGW